MIADPASIALSVYIDFPKLHSIFSSNPKYLAADVLLFCDNRRVVVELGRVLCDALSKISIYNQRKKSQRFFSNLAYVADNPRSP